MQINIRTLLKKKNDDFCESVALASLRLINT